MVVSTDTVDLVRFHFFFLASVSGLRRSWSWPGRIVCLVRRGATTLDGALRDVAGASSSLPTVELERFHRWAVEVPPARPPHRGPCSC
jgi:hypothetical protein